jgi:hypothetical protein
MVRIRKTRWKVAYIADGNMLLFALGSTNSWFQFPNPLFGLAKNILLVLIYLGGVRSFRGAGEPIQPPRDWWRITSQPRASFVIGSLLALSFASNSFTAVSGPPEAAFANTLDAAVDTAMVFLYIRSSIRLRRVPPCTVQELPRFRPVKPYRANIEHDALLRSRGV